MQQKYIRITNEKTPTSAGYYRLKIWRTPNKTQRKAGPSVRLATWFYNSGILIPFLKKWVQTYELFAKLGEVRSNARGTATAGGNFYRYQVLLSLLRWKFRETCQSRENCEPIKNLPDYRHWGKLRKNQFCWFSYQTVLLVSTVSQKWWKTTLTKIKIFPNLTL